MSLTAIVRALVAAGATPEMILAAVEAAEAQQVDEIARRRASDADRQRRHRERMSGSVTLCHVTERDVTVTERDAPPLEEKREVSPCTPSREKTQLSPDLASLGDTTGADEREIVDQGTTPKCAPTWSPAAPAEHPDFAAFWQAYPWRYGTNSRAGAASRFGALAKSGIDPGALIDGARRYARQCAARGIVGTEFVQQATTWLCPKTRAWEEAYELPDQPQRQQPRDDRRPPTGPVDPLHAAIGRRMQDVRDRERFADPAPGPAGFGQERDPFTHVGDREKPFGGGFRGRDSGRDRDGFVDAEAFRR